MDTAQITYLGDLRTEARHVRSGNLLITDAPVDNQGKGEAFSPTDLLCTALGTCMMTLVGITAQGHGLMLEGMDARVVKHMAAAPRRVARVEVHLHIRAKGLNSRHKDLLEHSARTCPVALSLSEALEQEVHVEFTDL